MSCIYRRPTHFVYFLYQFYNLGLGTNLVSSFPMELRKKINGDGDIETRLLSKLGLWMERGTLYVLSPGRESIYSLTV